MTDEIVKEQEKFKINAENEAKFAKINKIKIYKEIRKMEKLSKKRTVLLSENLSEKSRKKLKQSAEKIDKMIDLYGNTLRKLI